MRKHTLLFGFFCLLLLLASGCAGTRAFREARREEILQHWDLAVLKYSRAAELDPANLRYKLALDRAKLKCSQFHFEKGKIYRSSGRPELAVVELEQAVLLDRTNQYAEVELRKAREEAAQLAAERAGETRIETMKRRARGARPAAPMLEPSSDRPITLNFPQPKPIKTIYKALADAAGINVIFDPQLKDDNVSIVLTNMEFQRVLETLMRQENHFYKVIDEKTILIAADNPQNRKSYEDLVIRTFYLSNADVADVANALRSILQTTRLHANKADNSITMRDTADKVAIAERIVEQNDKQLAEVVVDVELLQINTTKAQDIGLLLQPSYSVTGTLPAPGGQTNFGKDLPAGSGFTWDQLRDISIRSFGFALPSVAYSFIKNNTDAELLAKPQLRISEGQKAQLVIGERRPVATTVFQSQIGGQTGQVIASPITSFQYTDIGIKIEVEPRVHHNKEVTLKLIIEVSNIAGFVSAPGQPEQPIIATRTISSNIRLKDGETNFLAGLFRTDKSNQSNKVPFLGDIPVLGRLFSRTKNDDVTTDLVLTLTPHIIRIPDITAEDLQPVYVGTDANISFQGTPRVDSPFGAGPFDFERREPAMPRGAPPVAPPPAVPTPRPLAPAGPPTDPFRPVPPPRQAVPPQTEARPPGASSASAESLGEPAGFDLEPAFLSLATGETRSLWVRVVGQGVPAGSSVTIRFDPSLVRPLAVRPIFSEAGVGDARIEGDRVVLEFLGGISVEGARVIAEIAFQGVAPGRCELVFEPAGSPSSSALVEVR